MFNFILILTIILFSLPVFANDEALSGTVTDRMQEAQERLLSARGSYKTIRMQEKAIENMRKATKLSLRAAQLRAKSERMQHKADVLVNKATLSALSRGLYITNPLAPVMMQPPPEVATGPAMSPVAPPVPGEPINISIPEQEEVSYEQNTGNPPVPDGF